MTVYIHGVTGIIALVHGVTNYYISGLKKHFIHVGEKQSPTYEGRRKGRSRGKGYTWEEMRTHQESGIYLRPVKAARRKRKIHFYDISFCNTEYRNYKGCRGNLIMLLFFCAFKK